MHEIVNPILQLAKRNIDHNSSKNDRFVETKKATDKLEQEIAFLRNEVS